MRTDPTEGRPDEAAPSRRLFVKGAAAAGIGIWAAPVITSMTSVAGAQGSPACRPTDCNNPDPCPDASPCGYCAPQHGGGGSICWNVMYCYNQEGQGNLCSTDADCAPYAPSSRCGDVAPGSCGCAGPAPTGCMNECAGGQVAEAPTVHLV